VAEWKVVVGDCIAVMKGLPDNSFDSMCTDPPSGTGFMGKDWDCFRRRHNPADVGRDSVHGRMSAHAPRSYGESDRGNFIAFMTEVMTEALRVLKPGAHCLVWALPRTSSWTARALEDSGFFVKDIIVHHFGSGFPKSMDLAKQIDSMGGLSAKEQADRLRVVREDLGISREDLSRVIGCTVSSIRDWEEGRARRKGGTIEYIIPSAEYRERLNGFLGYSSDERITSSAGVDRRGDGSVLGLGHSGRVYGDPETSRAQEWAGYGTALKPASEFWILAQKPVQGTIADNVLTHGAGALNIDACRVNRASDDVPGWHTSGAAGSKGYQGEDTFRIRDMSAEEIQVRCGDKGRWPPNLLLTCSCDEPHDDPSCPVAEMDRQSGRTSTTGKRSKQSQEAEVAGTRWLTNNHRSREYPGDSGGASRFFPTFRYQPKPSSSERNAGLDEHPDRTLNRVNPGGIENDPRWAPVQVKNSHPTLKGISLMKWLCQLITPAGGYILDPFLGSGSTGCAAVQLGYGFYGCDKDPEYVTIAESRIRYWEAKAQAPEE
jgi:DNA modification methylase/transcriptional regulator with XRE-family HTH domain